MDNFIASLKKTWTTLALPISSFLICLKLLLGTSFIYSQELLEIEGEATIDQIEGLRHLKTFPVSGDLVIDVEIEGQWIYVLSRNTLVIYHMDPGGALKLVHTESGSFGSGFEVVGNYAYVINTQQDLLSIYDVSSPSNINLIGSTNEGLGRPVGLFVNGTYAFVASIGETGGTNKGLSIFDISNPSDPTLTDFTASGLSQPRDVVVKNDIAYVVDQEADLLVTFDVSDPHAISLIGSGSDGIVYPVGVTVSGNYAYVVSEGTDDLALFDISNPAGPVKIGSTATELSSPNEVIILNEYALVTSRGNHRLVIFDISNPSSPLFIGFSDIDLSFPFGFSIIGTQVLVASQGNTSLVIFEINGLQTPAIHAGAIQTDQLQVKQEISLTGNMAIREGLKVDGPTLLKGNTAVANNLIVHGNLSLGGADIQGDARFRTNDYTNLLVRGPVSPFLDDVNMDFIKNNNETPSARIGFNGYTNQSTHQARIDFYTRGSGDNAIIHRLSINENGDMHPILSTYNLGRNNSSQRWNTVYTVNGVNQSSDRRLKTDIQELRMGLQEIQKLRPVLYRWRNDSEKANHYGLIAQDVQTILPDIVKTDSDLHAYQSVNYNEIIPVLIKAIQEQQQQIEDLKTQLKKVRTIKSGK